MLGAEITGLLSGPCSSGWGKGWNICPFPEYPADAADLSGKEWASKLAVAAAFLPGDRLAFPFLAEGDDRQWHS